MPQIQKEKLLTINRSGTYPNSENMIDSPNENPTDNPIINSPYAPPEQHWEISATGNFTQNIRDGRRSSVYYVPVAPKSRANKQTELELIQDDHRELPFEANALVNGIRERVNRWRLNGYPGDVKPETRRLLDHWRSDAIQPPPFFCQLEAAETIIWLTEVVRKTGPAKQWLDRLEKGE